MRNLGKRVLGDSEGVIRNGNWDGNDTCWRMAVDLNRAVLYGNAEGRLDPSSRRPYLSIVDGIIAGEGNGPLCPEPVDAGLLVAGTSPVTVDATVARLMHFDWRKVPIIRGGADPGHPLPLVPKPLDALRVRDLRTEKETLLNELTPGPRPFEPHFGWASLRS